MKKISSSYYVRIRPQLNGRNLVHRSECPLMHNGVEMLYLGKSRTPQAALILAMLYFPEACPCTYCLNEYKGRTDMVICNSFFWN